MDETRPVTSHPQSPRANRVDRVSDCPLLDLRRDERRLLTPLQERRPWRRRPRVRMA